MQLAQLLADLVRVRVRGRGRGRGRGRVRVRVRVREVGRRELQLEPQRRPRLSLAVGQRRRRIEPHLGGRCHQLGAGRRAERRVT